MVKTKLLPIFLALVMAFGARAQEVSSLFDGPALKAPSGGASGGSVSGLDETAANLLYCRLDGTNGPLTAAVVINSAGGTNSSYAEGGIDRSSGSTETFNIQNSGAGVVTLQRDGFTVWDSNNDGAGSGLDADLLDGVSSAGFCAIGGCTLTGVLAISPTATASDALRITGASGHTGPYFNVRPEDDGANATAFDLSPAGASGSLSFTMRPVTTGSTSAIFTLGSSAQRVMGVANNNAVFLDTTMIVGATVTSGAAAASTTGMTIGNGFIDDASTAAGVGMRIASNADSAGETGVDVGTTNTATTGTCLRVVTDADGTPAVKLAVECDGTMTSTQVTSGTPVTHRLPTAIATGTITLPTCSTSADAGKMFYVDDTDDAASGMVCVCRANSAGTYANVDISDNSTACIDP